MAIKINGNTVIADNQAFTTISTISATGNITSAANILSAGYASVTGNVTGGNVFALENVSGNLIVSTSGEFGIPSGQTVLSLANARAETVYIGDQKATNLLIGNATSNTQFGGNIKANGFISVSGNVTGGNIIGTIVGNVSTTTISATGNITGGNLLTGGLISATGNITTAGNINLGGNIVDSSALNISTSTGDITLSPAGNVSVNSKNINNVAQPTQNQDAATKLYVDNAVSTAISYHEAVAAATTANLATTTGGTITYAQPNGAGNGIGATITTTGSFNLIDTANVQSANTRILVKNEGNAVLNGVYVWSNATVITRSADADEAGLGNSLALGLNDYFFVSSGNVNKGSAFVVNAPTGTITFGTSNITFAQFSNSQVYTANTSAGLSLIGTVFSAKVDGTTTAFDGGGNISVKAGANLTTPNIGAATGTSLSTTGAITGAALTGTSLTVSTGNITGGNLLLSGAIIDSAQLDIQTSAANANIALAPNGTGIVTVSTQVSATGNVTGGNIRTGGLISATSTITSAANITGGNLVTAGLVSATGNVTGGNILTAGIMSSTGNGIHGNVVTGGLISATGAITGAALTGTSLTVSTGNVSCGNIVNTNANGVGNIGTTTTRFNQVFALASSAQYADLAEKYTADATYPEGTVVSFGGSEEVTVSNTDSDSRVAGVISTNPSFRMNDTLESEHTAMVALTGRVPTKVTGTVRKGDLMVSAGNGSARAEADPRVGTVIGKALADHDGDSGVIEVVVGRF
jgi:filamentous hemagglutinin